MVVSFKLSKNGTRFRRKPKPESDHFASAVMKHDEVDAVVNSQLPKLPRKRSSIDLTVDHDGFVAKTLEAQVSFILSIFPDGYLIEKPYESNVRHPNIVQDDPKILHPYDRRSESLIAAIECGQIPTDFLHDIPCKYINGAVVCEVRDYRKKSSESGYYGFSTTSYPSITRVSLKISLDKVVKDLHQISDSSWGYGDLIEAESRILNALHPELYLDPTPNLDRLCKEPTSIKLNLDIRGMRLKRLRQTSRATTMPENTNSRAGHSRQITGQPDFVNLANQNVGQCNMMSRRPKNHGPSSSVPAAPQISHQLHDHIVVGNPRYMQDHAQRGSSDGISPIMLSGSGKSGNRNGEMPSMSNSNKRSRLNTMGFDDNKSQTDSISAPGSCLKKKLLQQQSTVQKQMFDGSPNKDSGEMEFTAGQKGVRYSMAQEPVDTERAVKMDPNQVKKRLPQHFTRSNFYQAPWNMCQSVENNTIIREEFSGGSIGMHFGAAAGSSQSGKMAATERIDISEPNQVPKRLPQHFTRFNDSQAQCNNISQPLDKSTIMKEDNYQRRTSTQSFSSPNSGEFTNGPIGEQVGAAVGSSQREKPVVNSMGAIYGTRSLTCSINESMHPEQISSDSRSKSISKTPDFSVGNRIMRDRFSIIQNLTARFKLECRNNKNDTRKDENVKKTSFPAPQLIDVLVSDPKNDTRKDETCTMLLSKSLVSGNINICKTRILNFVKEEPQYQLSGDVLLVVPEFQIRLMLSERQSGHTVAMHYGELDDYDCLAEEELIFTLPNTHTADLLAAQFCSLMLREGYHHLESDHLKPKPMRMVQTPGSLPNTTYGDEQFREAVSGQATSEVAKRGTSHQDIPNSRMHAQGSGVLPPSRSQETEPKPSTYQQQPLQRSSVMMLTSNPISMGQDTTMQQQTGIHNSVSSLQPQLLQRQQQSLMQGEMMMGPGSIGSMDWNIGENSRLGVQGFGNVTRMEGATYAGTTVVSAMMGQNTMSINHSSPINGAINQQLLARFAIMDTKPTMSVSTPNVLSGLTGQSSDVGGLQRVIRQIHQGSSSNSVPQLLSGFAILETESTQSRPNVLSGPWGESYNIYTSGSSGSLILDSGINRVKDMNPMQRNVMAPPGLMSGMNKNQNLFMNQQQVHLPRQGSTSNLQYLIWPTKQDDRHHHSLECHNDSGRLTDRLWWTSPQLNSLTFSSVGNNMANSPM